MDGVTWALGFVYLWGLVNTQRLFGTSTTIRAISMLVVASGFAWLTHFAFYAISDVLEKKEFENLQARLVANNKKIKRGVPFITAIILVLCFQLGTPLYVVAITAIVAELVGKLMWGGFGKNIVNPAGVAFLLAGFIFGSEFFTPGLAVNVDAVSSATPLMLVDTHWYYGAEQAQAFQLLFGNFWDLLVGNVPGSMAEMSRLGIILAFAFMVYKKIIDWTIPAIIVGSITVMTLVVGLIHGFDLMYPFFHLLNGGLLFGTVFMATDPSTIPKNKAAKVMFSIVLATLTLILRFRTLNYIEGFMIALIIMNLFHPWINEKLAPLNKKELPVRRNVYIISFVSSLVVVLLLTIGL